MIFFFKLNFILSLWVCKRLHFYFLKKKKTFSYLISRKKIKDLRQQIPQFIRLLPINLLERQIRPEDLLVGDVHVQCNNVFLTGDDLLVLALIQCHLPHLMVVSEE